MKNSAIIVILFGLMLFSCAPGYDSEAHKLNDFKIITPDGTTTDYTGGPLPNEGSDDAREFRLIKRIAGRMLPYSERLSIIAGPSSYPFDLYLNGSLIHHQGSRAPRFHGIEYKPVQVNISREHIDFAGVNELMVVLYLKHKNNPLFDIVFSPAEKASSYVFWRTFFGLTLVQAAFAMGIVIGLYFLFLFFLQSRGHLLYILVAGFSLTFAFNYINMTFNHTGIDPLLIQKISRMSFPASLLFMNLFACEYTGYFSKNRKYKLVNTAVACIFIIAALLQPSMNSLKLWFNNTMLLYILPNLLFTFSLFVMAAIKKDTGRYLPLLLVFIVIILTSAHDIYYVSTNNTPYAFMVVYGYMLLMISIFFNLAYDQSVIYKRSVRQARDLNTRNEAMAEIFSNIRNVSDNLVDSSQTLTSVVTNSVSVIDSYSDESINIQSQVKNRFTSLEDNLQGAMSSLRSSSEKINGALDHQRQIISEVTESVRKMDKGVVDLKDAIKESTSKANEVSRIARDSQNVVQESQQALSTIMDLSIEIHKVLTRISEIADKTNTLSINAAIEAARSGKHGRGFKIVASNIRNLAIATGKTAAETYQEVDKISDLLTGNNKLSGQVNDVLATVVEESRGSASTINQIFNEVSRQQKEFSEILNNVAGLQNEAESIHTLQGNESHSRKNQINYLNTIKETLGNIGSSLGNQMERAGELKKQIDSIQKVAARNNDCAKVLHEIIANAQRI